jgi:hypothetical protein
MLNPTLMGEPKPTPVEPKIGQAGNACPVFGSVPPAIPVPIEDKPNSARIGCPFSHPKLKTAPSLAGQPMTINDLAVPGLHPGTAMPTPPLNRPPALEFVAYIPLNVKRRRSVVPTSAVRRAK